MRRSGSFAMAGSWILSAAATVLVLTTNVHTLYTSCTDATYDTVSCNFYNYFFCYWINDNIDNDYELNWDISEYAEYSRGYYYAYVYMGNRPQNKYTSLRSSLQCPTRNELFKLSFYYFIGCDHGNCELSVIIEMQNGSKKILWNTQNRTERWYAKEIEIMSPAASFQILFKAKVLLMSYALQLVAIDSIKFQHSATIATTASPKTSEKRATTIFPWAATTAVVRPAIIQEATSLADSKLGSDEDTEDNKVGIAIGITVSLLATAVVVTVVVVAIRRRKCGNSFGFGSVHLLPCLEKKRKPGQSSLDSVRSGAANATNSQSQGGVSTVSNAATAGDIYAKVNKKSKASGGRGTHKHTMHGLSDTLNYELAVSTFVENRERDETDGCYIIPDDAASTHNLGLKGDNGYDLTNVNQSKVTGKKDEYNKLSHQPNGTTPAGPHTSHAYDHLDEDKKTASGQQTSTSDYSLAEVDNESSVHSMAVTLDIHFTNDHSIVPTKSDGKTNYVNVNSGLKTPLQTTEAQYNRLDFDRQHEAKATCLEKKGHDVYNHLRDEDGEYHQLHLDHDQTHNAEVRSQDNTDGYNMYYHLQVDV